MKRKPEPAETNAARQARLRERRKAQGFKRVSVWLSAEQISTLECLGGELWLGSTVRALLESAMNASQQPGKPATRVESPGTVSDTGIALLPDNAKPVSDNKQIPLPDNRAVLAKVCHVWAREGLSKTAIAQRCNALGWTPNQIPKTTNGVIRKDAAAAWTLKTISQLLMRDYPD